MVPFAVSSLFVFTLLLLPILALPVTPPMIDASQSSSTRTGGDLVLKIAFSLALFLTFFGISAWLATGRSLAQFIESFNRMHTALIAVTEKLLQFRVSSLIDRAAATILSATDPETTDTPR